MFLFLLQRFIHANLKYAQMMTGDQAGSRFQILWTASTIDVYNRNTVALWVNFTNVQASICLLLSVWIIFLIRYFYSQETFSLKILLLILLAKPQIPTTTIKSYFYHPTFGDHNIPGATNGWLWLMSWTEKALKSFQFYDYFSCLKDWLSRRCVWSLKPLLRFM